MIEPRVNIRTKLKIVKGKPDLTPLVDVLFLLLIFFILSSSFVELPGVKVTLPETEQISGKTVGKVFVTINERSKFYFDDKPTDWVQLKQDLSKIRSKKGNFGHENITIVIRADKKTPFGAVARLLAFAEKIELNVVLATVKTESELVEIKEAE